MTDYFENALKLFLLWWCWCALNEESYLENYRNITFDFKTLPPENSPVVLSLQWIVFKNIIYKVFFPLKHQYVVIPNRRASAEAFQLMASHALGEAGSPYLSGLIADQIKSKLENTTSTCESFFLIPAIIFKNV